MPPNDRRRITICPIEATNNYGELTRFEVDAATTSLRDVVERIHADPMLHCKQVRVGTRLLTYEDDVTGDPIDMFSPAVALEPLAAIVLHLLPCAAANGLTEFAEGQELWLVVDGCATDSDAIQHIGRELLFSRFDSIARQKERAKETIERQKEYADLRVMLEAMSLMCAKEALEREKERAKEESERRKENAALRAMIEAIGLMCAQSAPNAAAAFALESALKGRKVDVVNCLAGLIPKTKADGNGSGPLHAAASNGHSDAARVLVKELGVSVRGKDDDGCTPLHVAAANGHADVSRVLVNELGSNVFTKDKCGRTSLHVAARNGHAGAVRVLMKELGADVWAKDEDSYTPLHAAAQHGHADVACALVTEDLGTSNSFQSVNRKTNDGRTPLYCAAENGHADVVRALAVLDANVNRKDKHGRTPLYCAARNGHADVVRVLAKEWDVNVNSKDKDGWTPLHWAAFVGHADVARVLVEELNADANIMNNAGKTPSELVSGYDRSDFEGIL